MDNYVCQNFQIKFMLLSPNMVTFGNKDLWFFFIKGDYGCGQSLGLSIEMISKKEC
jgi:hypothetical protein